MFKGSPEMLYQVLYVRRSDGKLDITHRGRREKNEPTPEQLDQTPDANGIADYYRELGPNESKVLDWRRKLASMLMKNIANSSSTTGYSPATLLCHLLRLTDPQRSSLHPPRPPRKLPPVRAYQDKHREEYENSRWRRP